MLKKLLDEFSEKEAHTREEINVITEQIGELEKRVLASQVKLSTVSGDREKVRMMQDRYSGGSTLTSGGQLSGQNRSLPEEPKEKESRARPGRAERAAAAAAAVTPAPATPPAPPPAPEPGIPPAPLNMRASSTRLPAAIPAAKPVLETPAETSSPFLSAPDPIPASQTVSNPFTPAQQSPADLFTAPLPQEPVPAPEVDANSAQPVDTTVQSNYTSSQPVDTGAPTNESNSPFFRPTSRPDTAEPTSLPQAEAVPQTLIQPSADPQQAQPQLVSQQDDALAQVQDLEEEEPDDTVKSINDALRGLFR
jgi:hypothetical protein